MRTSSVRVALAATVTVAVAAVAVPAIGPVDPPSGGVALSAADATAWTPTAAETERARVLVHRMRLGQQAGQVIVASYTGTTPPTALVKELHLGGVISFASNLTTPAEVRSRNRALQASVASRGFPLMIGVDQEGGRVARLTTGATRFPAFMTAGAADDPALTREAYTASGGEVADVGFTIDLAPDADVTMGPADPAIGARSAGSAPVLVGRQVVAAMTGIAATGLVPALKHFPGHGSVTTDSHVGLPVQRKSKAALQSSDLVPFKSGIAAHAPVVMVGHIDVRAIDPGVPSSLSRKVVAGLLRGTLKFGGVAITDSLTMKAVADRYGVAGAAVRALVAGEDILLMPGNPRVARQGIVDAIRDGRLSRARLEAAATRMVALLVHQKAHGFDSTTPGSSEALSQRFSAAGITSIEGACSGRLVGDTVHVTGPPAAVQTFTAAAQAAGLAASDTGTTVRLAGPGAARQAGDVVVALDTPYVLGPSTAPVKIATYGESPGAMRALVDVLLGNEPAPGTLPVVVPGAARSGC